MGGLSNWLARRPVKPLPAGHVGSSPTPPTDTNFTFPGNSVGLECHLYTLEVGGSNPSSGTTFERMVAQLAEVMVLETIKCEFESHSSDKLNKHKYETVSLDKAGWRSLVYRTWPEPKRGLIAHRPFESDTRFF